MAELAARCLLGMTSTTGLIRLPSCWVTGIGLATSPGDAQLSPGNLPQRSAAGKLNHPGRRGGWSAVWE